MLNARQYSGYLAPYIPMIAQGIDDGLSNTALARVLYFEHGARSPYQKEGRLQEIEVENQVRSIAAIIQHLRHRFCECRGMQVWTPKQQYDEIETEKRQFFW